MKNEGFFYPKLAFSNMKRNAGIYVPYLLAGVLLAGLYYMVLAVGEMTARSDMSGGGEMYTILRMCAWLCVIIMIAILFYINSFVMKRRKRELGLYCILGMEKRHLCRLLFWEAAGSALISIAGGVLFGVLFSQLMFLVLLKLLKLSAKLIFIVPFSAVKSTFIVFLAGYFLTLLYDWIVIFKTNPIDLLKSRQEGEREPKTKWLTALVGVITLGAGYYLALKVQTVSEGIFIFFPAAGLVIIGTYCLFLAGSIVLLKFLRKRKSFYYKPENFISVSGMLYRMKQNAAGLATIAILSTALLVVLSSSVTLYSGEEDRVMSMFPREYRFYMKPSGLNKADIPAKLLAQDTSDGDAVKEYLAQTAEQYHVKITNEYEVYQVWWMADKKENAFSGNVMANKARDFDMEKMVSLTILSLEDYNRMTGKTETLAADEVLYVTSGRKKQETITIKETKFRVKGQMTELRELPLEEFNQDMFPSCTVIVPDRLTMMQLRDQEGSPEEMEWYCLFDLEGEPEEKENFVNHVIRNFPLGEPHRLESREENRNGFYVLYGSILFVGLLFVALFLLATVLIIYYKQVTEGYDDRERFAIMEKVGMRDSEILKAIRKQVLIVFFLPLFTAILHICVAARVLRMFLALLGLVNVQIFWIGMAVCCIVFAAVYLAVYRLTSRTYYRIVRSSSSHTFQ